MLDSEIIEEIETTYANEEQLNKILDDIKNDVNIAYWANEFCQELYYGNFDLAQSMYEYLEENAKEYRDFRTLAFAVGTTNGLNNKEWARDLINTAIPKITLLRDLRVLADDIATKNLHFYDRGLAMELYKEALEKSTTAYDFYCIAESLSNAQMLNDKDWAIEVYQKAIESAKDSDELTYIADSIADEESLNDEKWADELYEIAQEFDGSKE